MNAAPKLDRKFTYKDYLNWPEGERWELINGIAYDMSPAPRPKHQKVSGLLTTIFNNFLLGKPCNVYHAPFDVRFSELGQSDEEVDTVVQPDISIVCDQSRLDERGYVGAPTLIVEILSESTASKDLAEKYKLYESNGVKEYLVVNTWGENISLFTLDDDGKYSHPQIFGIKDLMLLSSFPGLEIKLSDVFA